VLERVLLRREWMSERERGSVDEDKKTALDKGSAGLCRRKEVEGAR
jgi:hypothetical protein